MMNHTHYNRFFIVLFLAFFAPSMVLSKPLDTSNMPEDLRAFQNLASNNTFVFNPRDLRWRAINDEGKVVRSGPGSGGRGYCPDIKRSCRTPSGTYNVVAKRGADCRSSRYPVGKGGAPMPYCMFFSKYYAIHGSPDVPHRNASHGCIRVKPQDAKWLHNNFIKIGTKVVVKPY